jgi:SAM-dependent methyltransferase
MSRPAIYVHGTAASERQRLARMNRFLNDACLRELTLGGGERVLDLGAGLGHFARAMARAVGTDGAVVAIERSAEQIADARRLAELEHEPARIDLRRGDALDPPLRDEEWASFDVAHTRFLLEHLPDPLQAVRVLVRAVRPGGRVVLADDDHDVFRLWPEVPAFERAWRAYAALYTRVGNDPIVGRRLVELLVAAGARPTRNTFVFFGGCAGQEVFPDVVANMAGVVEGARQGLLEAGLLTAAELEAGLDAVRAWGEREDAALWYGLCWAEGRRPA